MATTTPPLLDLNTLIIRAAIRIDGEDYELRNPGELSLEERVRAATWGAELRALDGTSTAEAAKHLAAALDRICALVLLAPADVQSRLSDDQRFAIAMAFIGLSSQSGRPAMRATTTTATAARTTGAPSSRASSGSTAGRRATGSRTRRSR